MEGVTRSDQRGGNLTFKAESVGRFELQPLLSEFVVRRSCDSLKHQLEKNVAIFQ